MCSILCALAHYADTHTHTPADTRAHTHARTHTHATQSHTRSRFRCNRLRQCTRTVAVPTGALVYSLVSVLRSVTRVAIQIGVVHRAARYSRARGGWFVFDFSVFYPRHHRRLTVQYDGEYNIIEAEGRVKSKTGRLSGGEDGVAGAVEGSRSHRLVGDPQCVRAREDVKIRPRNVRRRRRRRR